MPGNGPDGEDSSRPGPRPKVARVIDEYDLDGMGDLLERSWTGQGDSQRSLRELADHLNRAILRTGMERSGMDPVEGDVETAYDLLAGDASSGDRVQKRRELERNGVDVDAVEDDFVSHRAVHSYLRNHRDVERSEPTPEDRLATGQERIERLQGRTAAVTADVIDRLHADEGLDAADVDVLVNVRVLCNDCGRSHEVSEFLQSGGCDCETPE
ncbi:MAG TPA: hypothetical protein VJ898_05005 [Natrialbaceae archaeon]|nr:hypothetical protein [Natrialbaceae archaeon]